MTQLDSSEALTYNTVRLQCSLKSGGSSVGTAFGFEFLKQGEESIPALVTNKHVIAEADKGIFFLHKTQSGGGPILGSKAPVQLDNFEKRWIPHPDSSVDLCIMPIAPLLYEAREKGFEIFYTPFDKTLIPSSNELMELTALEDVIMVGYPIGIWDSHNNMPIIRKGITATHPAYDYEGKKEFLIDLACFPGSSGSPVLLFSSGTYHIRGGGTVVGSRIKLLGILYAGPQYTAEGEIQIVNVPTVQKAITTSQIPSNLGICIKSECLLGFEPILQKIVDGKQ
jgi:hypothetical protein